MSGPSRAQLRDSRSRRPDHERTYRRSRSRSGGRHERNYKHEARRRSRDRSREPHRTHRSRDRSPRRRDDTTQQVRPSVDGDRRSELPVRAATSVDDRSISLLAAYQARAGERATSASGTPAHMIAAYASGARMAGSSDVPASFELDKPRSLSDRPPEAPRFKCAVCRFQCHYETFGRVWRPMAVLEFVESVYMLRDPLRASSVTGVLWPLVIGAKCTLCNLDVCMKKSCSTFVSQCRACATCTGVTKRDDDEKRLG